MKVRNLVATLFVYMSSLGVAAAQSVTSDAGPSTNIIAVGIFVPILLIGVQVVYQVNNVLVSLAFAIGFIFRMFKR